MKALFFLLGTALVLSLAFARAETQQPQEDLQKESGIRLHLEGPAFSLIWDDAEKELITVGSYRRPDDPHASIPLVNLYNVSSGEPRSIDIMREFPGARFVNVDALALGPNGSVLVACEVGPGKADWERLLLYDNNSALISNLNVWPDDVSAVAMDGQGNMYVLATNNNEQSSEESYPLIVKYDAFGHTTQQMLPRSLFSEVDDPMESSHNSPLALLAVDDNAIRAYLPGTGEMVVLDHEGNIQTRVNVDYKLRELARADNYDDLEELPHFSPDGDLWFQVLFLGVNQAASPKLPRNSLVRFTPTGELEVPYQTTDDPTHRGLRLIGFTLSNEPVAYSQADAAGGVFIQTNPY